MNAVLVFFVFIYSYVIEVYGVEGEENKMEARGKGKYALLTHLAILLAVKAGLAKILLGIAFVISAVKAMVVMAWALAISKYAPHLHTQRPTQLNTPSIHFFYVAATKLFVLKIVYGIIFYVIVTKAWSAVLWLVQYLKDKEHHHEYVEFDHQPYHDDHDHGSYGSYGSSSQLAYSSYKKPVYGQKSKIYDSDGSYSIGGAR